MVVEAVVIVLVVVFCFLLFHTYSKVQFILSNAMSIDKKQQQKTQKRLISSASTPHTVLLFKERQCGASLVPIVLGIL